METTDRTIQIHDILKQYWGYPAFRPLQEDIILSVLEGRDTLALLPTGGGKSVCFQVPALALGGVCIVVTPLVSLMKDQVAHLKANGIKAAAIYSGMSREEILSVMSNALFDEEFRFLYVSPERLRTETFLTNLPKIPVHMIAVDEAHCISQWGYDFRPPYLQIAEIRQFFPQVPVLALTATATPEVVKDIQQKLHFKEENVFQKSFKRDNLTYFVVKESDKNGRMLRIMQRYPGTGVVYVRNRRKTQEVAEFLRQNGVSADYYHAGVEARERDRKQEAWMTGKTRVIVATNAFGMGIDKPDVRFVIHLDIPDTLEAYFQEAGRGGRDLKPSVAIMLYDEYDIRQLRRNLTLSFPPIERVREVYEHLCQHYKIPMGAGQNLTFPFSLSQNAKELKMDVNQYYNALRILEKTGAIVVSEHLRDTSKIHFKMYGDELMQYYKMQPQNETFVKLLLRSYAGVFTQFVNIQEEVIAARAEMTVEQVAEQLKLLHSDKVLTYEPQSEIPLLVFLENRIDAKHLYFDPKDYDDRKRRAEERLEAVIHYVITDYTCRSQLLLSYFGETKSEPCGSCDVCISHRKQMKQGNKEEMMRTDIKTMYDQNLSLRDILDRLAAQYAEDEMVEVMRRMVEEGEFGGES
ncbi:MAG: RecQ family ATP-dependent DNA helicase [Bacteroidales bacterium]|nr:RecQ family ATP-dependent DNA helicase [Bacteroidales bacterium]